MKCVKDCYFKTYVRTENKDGDVLYKGYYCELYDKRLESALILFQRMELDEFVAIRCKECENHETLYYNTKMNVFKRMVLHNAEERMDNVKKVERRR